MGLALSFLPMPEGATPMWRPTLAFLPYLLIHWVSLSLGARSVAFGGAIVGVVISLATNMGRGPFATHDPVASYDAACLFNLVTGTSTLWLSTLAAERNRAARALAAFERRQDVTEDDVARVVACCLRHRLRKDPLEQIDSGDRVVKVFCKVFERPESSDRGAFELALAA